MNISKQEKSIRRIYAVDLFCGAGGLTRGLLDAGIKVRAGGDLDPICEYPYEHNNDAEFLKKSVTELQPNDIRLFYRKRSLRLLAGCARFFYKVNSSSLTISNVNFGILVAVKWQDCLRGFGNYYEGLQGSRKVDFRNMGLKSPSSALFGNN